MPTSSKAVASSPIYRGPLPHITTVERLPVTVYDQPGDASRAVAREIADLVTQRAAAGKQTVLGLATGSTPVGVYDELIRLHREEGVTFKTVVTFNLDEYWPMPTDALQSYHRFMREHLFDHLDIPAESIHIPDGTLAREKIPAACAAYEEKIREAGGIDLQILGIGRTGHIGFNEPGSTVESRTRLITLDSVTRSDAASDFFGEWNVPTQAITMGMGTILGARKILLIALGEHKSKVIKEMTEGPMTPRVPASWLQEHADATVLVDAAAGKDLTASVTPWALGNIEWTDMLIKRAVIWLCEKTNKAFLKLDDQDFRDHNLHQLLRHHGPAQKIANRVFQWMMQTIEYHPAGTEAKRVICFSPHPDDDVISMGGTLIRLVEDGHETHIAYMTSGNIAVFDHDAARVADFATEYNRMFGIENERSRAVLAAVLESLRNKQPGQSDIEETLKIKGLIRWSEAKFGAFKAGCKEEHLHFLDLPFYRTGTIAKKPISDDDVQIIYDLIKKVDPHQIYVAGDLSDPHGTHRVCAQAIFRAVKRIEAEGGKVPDTLLYRGAWQEYELHDIEIAVPLSPGDLARKRKAIFMHESQKDEALFPGSDPREFWQRAEDRNKGTADRYNRVGLPEYYAMEAFVRWNGVPI
ncbi:MAG: glucosamine-6-phosphate deaminase [Planctomycetia bacterium]|nr:glucosamine-6-phosphate deaminase [Planctomycetia bacterium]